MKSLLGLTSATAIFLYASGSEGLPTIPRIKTSFLSLIEGISPTLCTNSKVLEQVRSQMSFLDLIGTIAGI